MPLLPEERQVFEHFSESSKATADTSGPWALFCRRVLKLDDEAIRLMKERSELLQMMSQQAKNSTDLLKLASEQRDQYMRECDDLKEEVEDYRNRCDSLELALQTARGWDEEGE